MQFTKKLLSPALVIVALMAAIGANGVLVANARDSYVSGQLAYQGAIRCTDGEWGTIDDAGHQSMGITSVTATSTYVQINHAHVDQVGSVLTQGDLDYAMHGIVVYGPSAGFDYDRVYIFKNGARINPALACDLPSTNIWITAHAG